MLLKLNMRIGRTMHYGIVILDIIEIVIEMDVLNVQSEVIVHERQQMIQNMIVERENIMIMCNNQRRLPVNR